MHIQWKSQTVLLNNTLLSEAVHWRCLFKSKISHCPFSLTLNSNSECLGFPFQTCLSKLCFFGINFGSVEGWWVKTILRLYMQRMPKKSIRSFLNFFNEHSAKMYNRGTVYWQFWPAELTFSVLIEEHNLPLQRRPSLQTGSGRAQELRFQQTHTYRPVHQWALSL